ncbi:MAG: hypothetical protein HKL83_03695 [Acidimicrobiaceae bacterium]|nr:hypothetical protein [Acidimicrobiaceae bacterium]
MSQSTFRSPKKTLPKIAPLSLGLVAVSALAGAVVTEATLHFGQGSSTGVPSSVQVNYPNIEKAAVAFATTKDPNGAPYSVKSVKANAISGQFIVELAGQKSVDITVKVQTSSLGKVVSVTIEHSKENPIPSIVQGVIGSTGIGSSDSTLKTSSVVVQAPAPVISNPPLANVVVATSAKDNSKDVTTPGTSSGDAAEYGHTSTPSSTLTIGTPTNSNPQTVAVTVSSSQAGTDALNYLQTTYPSVSDFVLGSVTLVESENPHYRVVVTSATLGSFSVEVSATTGKVSDLSFTTSTNSVIATAVQSYLSTNYSSFGTATINHISPKESTAGYFSVKATFADGSVIHLVVDSKGNVIHAHMSGSSDSSQTSQTSQDN